MVYLGSLRSLDARFTLGGLRVKGNHGLCCLFGNVRYNMLLLFLLSERFLSARVFCATPNYVRIVRVLSTAIMTERFDSAMRSLVIVYQRHRR